MTKVPSAIPTVAVVKHHYHAGFEFDVPGKDSYRFAQAGADHVIVAAPDRVAQVRRYEHEPAMAEVVVDVRDVALILTEGYKRADAPKIEVSRRERRQGPPERGGPRFNRKGAQSLAPLSYTLDVSTD